MTMQSPERVILDGTDYVSYDCPLDSLPNLPPFVSISTADIRGYSALWTVVADRLYLVHVTGYVDGATERGVRLVFSKATAPVLAEWYSGILRLHGGRVIWRGDAEMTSEIEVLLSIRNGLVTHRQDVRRPVPSPQPTFDPILFRPIEELELEPQVLQALQAAGIRLIGDFVQVKELDLIHTYAIDVDTALSLRDVLAARGLIFGTPLPGWQRT